MASPDSIRLLPLREKAPSVARCDPVDKQKLAPEHPPGSLWHPRLLQLIALTTTLIVPPVVLIVWWFRCYKPWGLQLWSSAPIGGEFDQMVAKIIDLIAGALLAPLAMALINLVWFRYARIAACNETSKDWKGTRLVSLLEMSVTSGGTYDPWKLWSLLCASRIRLTLMAALALLSAISTSLFVNIIAYEALPIDRYFDLNSHRVLGRLPSLEVGMNLTTQWGVSIGNWSKADYTVVVETTSTLNQISYGILRPDTGTGSGQGWLDMTGQYVAVDATRANLDGIPLSVIEMWNVPASRLGVKCAPANMSMLSFAEQGADITLMSAFVQLQGREDTSCNGGLKQFSGGGQGPRYAILWENDYSTNNETSFVLATFNVEYATPPESFTPTILPSIPSAFGDLQPRMQDYNKLALSSASLNSNMTTPNLTVTWYGIACDLHRSHGFANLTRSLARVQDWIPTFSQFTDPEVNTSSLLYPMTKAVFPYQSPTGWISGIGTALGNKAARRSAATSLNGTIKPPDMEAYANAFVYASGAVEASMLNSESASYSWHLPQPERYPITGMERVLKYRMTYVPGILLFGLLAMTLCAAIVLGMTVASWSSVAFRSMRVVDGPRFVVDFAEAVKADDGLADAAVGDRRTLEKWTDGIRLRYMVGAPDESRDGDEGHIQLVQTGLK